MITRILSLCTLAILAGCSAYAPNPPMIDIASGNTDTIVDTGMVQNIDQWLPINTWITYTGERTEISANKKTSNDFYIPNLSFSYPSERYFDCCDDRDYTSIHHITINSWSQTTRNQNSIKEPWNNSNITISQIANISCPKNKPNCNREEIIASTADETISNLIQNINDYQTIKLPNIEKDVISYIAGNTKIYILQVQDNIFLVSFKQYQKFDQKFIETFLQKLKQ